MTQNNRFTGLRPLWTMETERWTKTYNWLKASIVWTLIINGLILLVSSQASLMNAGPIDELGLDLLFQLLSGICPVGAIIMVHSSLITERENGTLAWVLSAPVSRLSVFVSKLGVNLLYILSIVIMLQGIIARQIIQYLSGATLQAGAYYLGIAQMAVYIALWVTFTLMASIILPSRATVMGVSLGALFFHGTIAGLTARFIPFLPRLIPSALLSSAVTTATGGTIDTFAVIVSLAWITVFILTACFSFEKEEL